MKANLYQNSLRYGEVTPDIYGRTDLDAYKEGVKTLSNFIVKRQGGVTRRPGTVYDTEVSTPSRKTRIIPFVVAEHRFIVEVTGGEYGVELGTVRVYKETSGALSLETQPDIEFYLQNNGLATSGVVGGVYAALNWGIEDFPLATGMGPYRLSGSVPGGLNSSTDYWVVVCPYGSGSAYDRVVPTAVNHPTYLGFADSYNSAMPLVACISLSSVGPGKLTLTHNTTGNVFQSNHIIEESDLDDLVYDSKDTTLYFGSKNGNLYALEFMPNRNTYDGPVGAVDYSFRMYAAMLGARGPLVRLSSGNSSASSLIFKERISPMTSPGVVFDQDQTYADNAPVDWSNVRFTPLQSEYTTILGRDRSNASNWATASVNASITSDSTGIILKPFSASAASISCDYFALGSAFDWHYQTGGQGAADVAAIAQFRGRLMIAGGKYPSNIYASGLSRLLEPDFLPLNTDGTITSNTAFAIEAGGDLDAPVAALVALDEDILVISAVGTSTIGPHEDASGFSSTNLRIVPVNKFGGSHVMPARLGDGAFYVGATGTRIYYVTHSGDNLTGREYDTAEISLYCEHVFGEAIARIVYQVEPDGAIWSLGASGNLVSLTIGDRLDAVGSASHSIAGDTVTVEDICTMLTEDGTAERVYMLVQRDINGTTKRYIEHVGKLPALGSDLEDACYLDCAGKYSGSAVTNVPATTFDHLNGETVDVFADGEYVGTKVISGGQFTVALGTAAAKINVGYKYNSDLETLPPDLSLQTIGSTQGSFKRVPAVALRLHESYGGQAGDNSGTLDALSYDSTTPALFSGDMEVPIEGSSERAPTVFIRANEPYPMNIMSILQRSDVAGRGGE